MALAGASPNAASGAISELLGAKVRAAQKVGLKVLFCIGETAEQVPARKEVLARQIEGGLGTADMANVVIAYEPVWAIGPGKTPPSARGIADIAADIKRLVACPLVYGGGLKKENAASIGAISELDGGLVALTRFRGYRFLTPTSSSRFSISTRGAWGSMWAAHFATPRIFRRLTHETLF